MYFFKKGVSIKTIGQERLSKPILKQLNKWEQIHLVMDALSGYKK